MSQPYEFTGPDRFLPPGVPHELGRAAITQKEVQAVHLAVAQLANLSRDGHDKIAVEIIPAIVKHWSVLNAAKALVEGILDSLADHYGSGAVPAPPEVDRVNARIAELEALADEGRQVQVAFRETSDALNEARERIAILERDRATLEAAMADLKAAGPMAVANNAELVAPIVERAAKAKK